MKIGKLLLGILFSLILYVAIFCFFVKKPILYGELNSMITKKYDRLEKISDNKLVILAGSNGRYSHSAKTMGDCLHMPAVNLSITASISIDWQLELIKRHLNSGDIIFLPLEPHNYNSTEQDSAKSTEGIYCLLYNKREWLKMSLIKKYYTFYHTDLFLIFEDILERAMLLADVKPRSKGQNEFGDEIGHTPERGKPYFAYINSLRDINPYQQGINTESYSMKKLSDFLQWASLNKIRVFGCLPTIINTVKVPQNYVEQLKSFYEKYGHKFIVLDNNAQYDISLFYDTPFHLNTEGQKLHSEKVAQKIKEELNKLN